MTDTPLILIVDDNLLLQQVTARALSQAGYRTCTADDGQAALRLAHSEKPDLILLDVVLPDINGFEVCRQLKADPALTDCFIVMLSSVRIDSLSLIEGLEGGADGYIARPIPNDELLARVRGLLRIKQAEDRLRESEERYHTLIEQAADGIFVADANGKCIEVNSMGCALLGYARAEILQKSIQDLAPQDELSGRPFKRADFEGGHVVRNERHMLRKDGSRLPVEISARILTDGRWQAIVRDITERKRAEEAVRRASRLYAVLSQVNQTIVRVKERDDLFKAICRIAIEFGQFRMAWIGLIDAPTGRVKPIVHHGYEEGYLQNIDIDVNPASPFCQGPSGQAILEGEVVTSEDIETDPRMLPWRDEALKRGYRSSAAVPFRLKGEVIGALTLYASEPGFFSEEEQNLLKEIGLDISFALDSIAAQAEREQAEEALRESEGRFREIFENMSSGVVVYEVVNGGEDFKINHFNRAAEKIEGISRESVIGQTVCEAFPGVKALGLFEVFQRVWQTGNPEHFPLGFYQDDRIAGWRENYVARLPSCEVVAVYDDVTARKQAEEQIRSQLDELQRWQDVMLNREDRVQELKREVNELCRRVGETVRYPSQVAGDGG
jgi:PAS domain S-box-containing protein